MNSPTAAGHARTRQPVRVANPQARGEPRAPAVTPVTITWGVSRRALGEHAPAGRSPLVHLQLDIDANALGAWSIRDPRSAKAVILGIADGDPVECTPAGDCLLIRSEHIHALIRTAAETPELLYARTPIFQTLNIPGGRYQVIGVELR